MCTGDNLDTATAISRNAGIITEAQTKLPYACMTGKDFRELVGPLQEIDDPAAGTVKDPESGKEKIKKKKVLANMKKFKEVIQNLRVLGRSSPLDKEILVTGVQENNGVVAVTGDGTNDAPALTKANVGFAMGITGTDVAKGACDIILLDDNFSSIITALKYGRNVYDNVRKFLQFQLSVNVVAMFIVFFGSVILSDSPLNAVQMLWVNLIMDTMGALALATEPPPDSILKRKPYSKHNAIVTECMWRNVFGHGIYQITVLCILIFGGPGWFCEVYWVACDKFVDDDKTKACEFFNPFYASELYENDDTLKFWEKKDAKIHFKTENFEAKKLKRYRYWKLVENMEEAGE